MSFKLVSFYIYLLLELTKHCLKICQTKWDGCSYNNKLHPVKPHLGYCIVTHLSRRDAVILRRLALVIHVLIKFLLTSDSQPVCNECKSQTHTVV